MALRLPDRGQLFYVAIAAWLVEERAVRECDLDPDTYLLNDLDFDGIDLAEFMLWADDRFGFDRHSPEAEALAPIRIMDLVEYCIINNSFNNCVPDSERGAGYRKATAWEVA
jgi:acyl carrier protein